MLKILIHRVVASFFILFILWISFFPEPLQIRYKDTTFFILLSLLFLSFLKNGFDPRRYFFQKRDLFIWLYLVLISFNLWFAQDKKLAMGFYKDLSVVVIALYFLIKNELRFEEIKSMMRVLAISAGLISLFGLWEMVSGTNIIYEKYIGNVFYSRFIGNRMMATLIHPNILGSYLISCFPLAYYFFKDERLKRCRWINMPILILISIGAILTFSRGTWIAFILMVSLWGLLRKRWKPVVFIWIAFFIFIMAANQPLSNLNKSIRYRFNIGTLINYTKYSHRTTQYLVTSNMLREHPLAGIGLNHYRMLFDKYSARKFSYEVMIPDSVYLMHLAETGLLGFCGLVIILIVVLRRGFNRLRTLNANERNLFFAILIGFIGLLFSMAFFDGFLWKTPLYLFWVFITILSDVIKTN